MRNCYFCEEAQDFSAARKRLPKDWPFENEIIYCDEYIFSIVGSGPQVVPYVLILPKRHVYSLSELDHNEWRSFLNCLEYLVNKGGYGNELCIFEHGGESLLGASSIDHCHVHVIRGEIGLYYRQDFTSYTCIIDVKDNSCISGKNYLLIGKYEDSKLDIKLAIDFFASEHQYFRRILAKQLNEQFWDWRTDQKADKMLEIMNHFSMYREN